MGYSKTTIVIPGYGLDSLPYDMTDDQAKGLLNAFAAAWHPLTLHGASSIPRWQSSDEPPHPDSNALVIIPSVSTDRLHGEWLSDAEIGARCVVRETDERQELLTRVLDGVDASCETVDEELAADLMAMGLGHLLMEMLTQKMHYFTNIDENVLQHQAIEAARCIVEGNAEEARSFLSAGFECLIEARERFYPVDCFLVDLCLLDAKQANEHLTALLQANEAPVNFLIGGSELSSLAPETANALRHALQNTEAQPSRVSLVGGEFAEVAAPLVPFENWLADFERGRREFEQVLGTAPRCWARKRFGFSPMVPQILDRFGYNLALHFGLDDGIYPDEEHAKLNWDGCDGTSIAAVSRLPLAIDSAAAMLQLPERLSESMQTDMVAAVFLARWPEMRTPWLHDLQRIQSYGDVFGRLSGLDTFAEDSGDASHGSAWEAREYMTPFLIQVAALGQPDAVSRYARQHETRARLDAARSTGAFAALLTGQPTLRDFAVAEATVVATPEEEALSEEDAQQLSDFERSFASTLAQRVRCGTDEPDGYLVFNPLSFSRKAVVTVPDSSGQQTTRVVPLKGCGFAWIPSDNSVDPPQVPLAEGSLLNNGLFEVHISEETGGIARVKYARRRPNRLSQQLAFRFEKAREIPPAEEGAEPERTFYTRMARRETRVTRNDSVVGEIETLGDLVDPVDDRRLAVFRQRVRVVRGVPNVDLEIELSELQELPGGNPWLCYYGCRFAWDDPAAALTRSVFGQAHGFSGDRFEGPHYFEISSSDRRTTIINHGLPFHRKMNMRMLDSLLIPEGESRRRFRFTIAIDQHYPQQAALSAMTPAVVIPACRPSGGTEGWLMNLSARNVVVTRFGDARPKNGSEEGEFTWPLRLMETEGRAAPVRLAFCRKPVSARKTDFEGNTLATLEVTAGGEVVTEVTRYEVCDIDVTF